MIALADEAPSFRLSCLDFDRELATSGPAGLFTFTHEQELQFDLFRTRDWRRRFLKEEEVVEVSWNHCVCIDSETNWPIYVLMTADVLVRSDSHTQTTVFETMQMALAYVQEQKSFLYTTSENENL